MNAKPDTMQFHRGHESDEHLTMKVGVIRGLRRVGYDIILGEHHCSDALAIKLGGEWPSTVAVEIERSPRNLLRNIKRDLAHGAEAVLIVCPDAATLAAAARTVFHHITSPLPIAFATPLTLQLLQPPPITEHNPSEKQEKPS